MKTNPLPVKRLKIRSIILLVLSILSATLTFAQQPEAEIKQALVIPVIDGIVDSVWATANEYKIDLPYRTETPTLGASGETTWKGLWSMEGLFLLVKVADDVFSPPYQGTDPTSNWMYDKPEIYIDCNYLLKDGRGPNSAQSGHYCIAPAPLKNQVNGGQMTNFYPNAVSYSYMVSGSSYLVEYFIPFAKLLDQDGNVLDKTATIGFDINIVDNDILTPTRNKMVWANNGVIDEDWNNMDDAGLITFESEPASPNTIPIEKISLSPGSISVKGGTLQLEPVVVPDWYYNDSIRWEVINQTGQASISSKGLITAIADGTVIINATSIQDPFVVASTTVTISGQTGSFGSPWNDFNLIKNWDFTTDLDNWGYWADESVNYQSIPVIIDDYISMTAGQADEGEFWHYQLNQSGFKAEPDVPYILKFKSWSSISKLNRVAFEDTPENNYVRYGTSPDSTAINGRSEWEYETSPLPTWYTFHVTFDQIKSNTLQKIQWNISNDNATVYLDSILLIKDIDLTTPNFLTVSTSAITLNSSMEATGNFEIISNTNWELNSDQPWLILSPSTGTGNKTISLTASANPLNIERQSIVTVNCPGMDSQTITVTQKAKASEPIKPGESTYGEHWSNDVWNKYNLIKDWNFNHDVNWWNEWIDPEVTGQTAPVYENGVIAITAAKASDGSFRHYRFSQIWFLAVANVPYVLKFKSWSNVPKTNMVNFEENRTYDNNLLYGASTDPEATNGRSEWTYNTITEPRWYTFHVVFDKMAPTLSQQILSMFSNADATTYLDSVILIR